MTLVRMGDRIVSSTSIPKWLFNILSWPALKASEMGPEDRECIAFVHGLRAARLDGKLRGVFTKIPHEVGYKRGNAKAKYQYVRQMAMGFIPGSGDYLFMWGAVPLELMRGGGFIEFKVKGERDLTDAQVDWKAWCDSEGVPYRVARTAAEGFAILREWGVLDAHWGVQNVDSGCDGHRARGKEAPSSG